MILKTTERKMDTKPYTWHLSGNGADTQKCAGKK